MQRASRSRAATQRDAATTSAAPPKGPESRRERKRQTDRVAQQQHRKRQKLYIEELESQLALLKAASQEPSSSRLAVQNLKLQQELRQLYGMWDEMESLMKRQMECRRASILNELQGDSWCSPDEQALPSDRETSPSESRCLPTEMPVMNDEPDAGMTEIHVQPIGDHACDIDMTHEPVVNVNSLSDQHHDAFNPGGDNDWPLDPSLRDANADPFFDAANELGTPRAETPWIPYHQFHQQQTRGGQVQVQPPKTRSVVRSQRATPPSDTILRPRRGSTPNNTTAPHDLHAGDFFGSLENFDDLFSACIGQYFPPLRNPDFLPSTAFPTLLGDGAVQAIIERAKENPQAVGPPTLEDFLFDNPRNTLSTDLKNYLTPVRQSRKVSEFLATYWVIYLFFRWQVLQTDEAYNALPPWFRPTMLQLSVVHPAGADLIAWPEIREGLVEMALANEDSDRDIATVTMDIGRYLTVDIKACSDGDLWGRSQQQIAAEILNLANWKLERGFFDRYPQWRGLAARQATDVS